MEKTLRLGKIEGKKEKGAAEEDSITDSMDMNLSKLWEIVEDRGACWVAESDTTWQLNNNNKNL